ncbi:MAG: hypothetical protein RMK84_08080 [Oscillochloridaceae bacterium]|nr:hypothetical protein [Chloroflexaceae bacterium]MDW8390070.1 hypothetical protein [Oscillochloridaceae bacterium]
MTVSSARPAALTRYARASSASATNLEDEARRLAEILAHFAARCTEYRVPEIEGLAARLNVAARDQAALAAWTVDVARAFTAADTRAAAAATLRAQIMQWMGNHPMRASLPLEYAKLIELVRSRPELARAVWNGIATMLDYHLAEIERVLNSYGSAWPSQIPYLLARMGPSLALLGMLAGGTVVATEWSRWMAQPVASPRDFFELVHNSVWRLMYRPVDEQRMRSITARLDRIHLALCGTLGTCSHPRPSEFAEPLRDPVRGILDVPLEAMYDPGTVRHRSADGRLYLSPQALMYGEHSLIGSYSGEQVRLARVGANEYAFGIAGLDVANAQGPNNFYAVALTSQGVSGNENRYFTYVKEQILGHLERLPEGITIHLAGHSMGGGMVMLALNDPEVQQYLQRHNITVGSVTTFGAVRPNRAGVNGVPPDAPGALAGPLFANTVVNHYVDTDDALALNVGAGHDPGRFANVHLLDDGEISDPRIAHLSYDTSSYRGLPAAAQVLPFAIDPAYHEVYAPIPPATAPAPALCGSGAPRSPASPGGN